MWRVGGRAGATVAVLFVFLPQRCHLRAPPPRRMAQRPRGRDAHSQSHRPTQPRLFMSVLACALLFLFALPSVLATVQIQFYTQSVPCSATNTPAATLTMRGDNSCESIVAPTGTPSAGQQYFARSYCSSDRVFAVSLTTFSDSSCVASTGYFAFSVNVCASGNSGYSLFGSLGGTQATCLAPLGTIPPVTTAPPVTSAPIQCYTFVRRDNSPSSSSTVTTCAPGAFCLSWTATCTPTNRAPEVVYRGACSVYSTAQPSAQVCPSNVNIDTTNNGACFVTNPDGSGGSGPSPVVSNTKCCATTLCNVSMRAVSLSVVMLFISSLVSIAAL
jgi:hypothetical protein